MKRIFRGLWAILTSRWLWLSAKRLEPLSWMLSVWPTTVMLPISSWLAAMTPPIEAISGSKPSVSSARDERKSSGSVHWTTRSASDTLSVPRSAGRSPSGAPATNSGRRAKSTASTAAEAGGTGRLSRGWRKISARSAGGRARARVASSSAWPERRSESRA